MQRIWIKDIKTEWNKELGKEWVKIIFEINGNEHFWGIELEQQAEILRRVCECEDKKYPPERGFQGRKMALRYLHKYLECATPEERRKLTEEMIRKPQHKRRQWIRNNSNRRTQEEFGFE